MSANAERDRATLILTARPGAGAITEALVARASARLSSHRPSGARWLGEAEAWAVGVDATAADAVAGARATACEAMGEMPVDANIVRGAPVAVKLLVADMESTIIEQEMLDELADYVGLRERIASITERAMRGELDFEAALRERVGLLEGLDAGVLDEVYGRVTIMPGARALVATLKARGAYCALVSGGFTVFTARVARELGFDEHQANVLEIAGGKLTGRVVEPILGREAKLAALQRLARERGLRPEETMAVGDGANDLAMLGAAGIGVAFRAKPKVREAAGGMANGAVVTHGDLTALLYLQGIEKRAFVA